MTEMPNLTARLYGLARSGKRGRDAVITELYNHRELRERAIRLVLAHNGSREDAMTVYADSILIVVKQMTTDKDFTISTSLNNYVQGVVKYTWYSVLRKTKTFGELSDRSIGNHTAPHAEEVLMDAERSAALDRLLADLGSGCREVLTLWSYNYSMQEIADQLGYDNAGVAKTKRYKCMRKLVRMIDENPKIKALLR